MTDPIDPIDLIEIASQPRLMRTFALQLGYMHPYVMEGERPREPQTVAQTFLSVPPAEPGSPERLLGQTADPVDRIALIEIASQPRLMRTFALQLGYAHPYVMEGERPREPPWLMGAC